MKTYVVPVFKKLSVSREVNGNSGTFRSKTDITIRFEKKKETNSPSLVYYLDKIDL